HQESQIGWPDDAFDEHAGCIRLKRQRARRAGTGIEQDADIQRHVRMVREELDRLQPAVFTHLKLLLVKVVEQAVLRIAHSEVHGDEVHIGFQRWLLGTLLRECRGNDGKKTGAEDYRNREARKAGRGCSPPRKYTTISCTP